MKSYRRIRLARGAGKSPLIAETVFLFQKTTRLQSAYAPLNRATGGAVAAAMRRAEFSAETGVISTVHSLKSSSCVFMVGLGAESCFDANTLRTATAKLTHAAFAARVRSLRLNPMPAVGRTMTADDTAIAIADGLAIAGFCFNRFKSTTRPAIGDEVPIDLQIYTAPDLRRMMGRGLKIGEALTTARTLSATPPNVAHPRYIAAESRRLAKQVGLRCTIISQSSMKRLGMEGIRSVGRAGSTPPSLICLDWPGHPPNRNDPILLVGKAVTFDTGGYSLKTGGSMSGMKYDKCGGMAVIGAMEAIARLKVRPRVIGLIPCAENMIDTTAYRVDDILTLCNGVTVEITNTDAEGRLLLADALAYGTKRYQPQAVIDLATLTGGVVVALGSFCAGMFCNNPTLRRRLETAATATGERLWPLPLWQDHRQLMVGTHSDLVNSAAVREAQPIQGAAFLSHFVGETAPIAMPTLPWAHLDIAGVASRSTDSPLYPKGPTGFGVRLLAHLIANW